MEDGLTANDDFTQVERDVLLLLSAHGEVADANAVHRNTLEVYARSGVYQLMSWAAQVPVGELRRVLAGALTNLRAHSLVSLAESGFVLTSKGSDVVAKLTADREIENEYDEARDEIGRLRELWSVSA